MDEEDDKTKLVDIWRTCNKIRAAIFRIGINLWKFFKPHDPNKNTLISESKFINVLGCELRGCIGLSNQEIEELTDYFRVQDGRIAYAQFCNVIHSNEPNNEKNQDLVTGLEWEDPMHVNRLSESENRRLCVLLTKIAQSVRLRELVLRPYFQDYELVSKNNGTVTFAHFTRVLYFLKLLLSSDDIKLLIKRFIKDSYTLNYIAFVEQIEKIVQYFDTHRMIDYSDDIITNFPGRLLDAELPKLPRPEIGVISIAEVFGKETSFHPVLKPIKAEKDVQNIILRIQRHVMENRIRVHEFFQDFDILRCGFITKSQFLRGLDGIGVSGLDRLFLSDNELQSLCESYADKHDRTRINWNTFENEIDKVFTIKQLDKKPYKIVLAPPVAVLELPKEGTAHWQTQSTNMRELCEESLFKVKSRIKQRRLYLEPMFKDFDKMKNCHVSRSQMRQVLFTNGILLSDEEIYALERRYNDDLGFNYSWFLNEADPQDFAIPKFEEYHSKLCAVNAPKKPKKPTFYEKDIVQVLAKIKGQVVRRRIRIKEFLKGYDKHNELCVCQPDFVRGLNSAEIKLTVPEVDLVCRVFMSPLRPCCVDYKRFCDVIEEALYQPCLERAPLITPMQHYPSDDCPLNFLNFDQRTVVSKALQKLARKPDQISNLLSIFTDYDHNNCGTLSSEQFLRGLTLRGLNNIISSHEFEIISKCFGIERGLRLEVDYRAFLNALDMLYATKSNYPF